ncbi:MAG: hypothetical protein AB7O54_15015 [Pseudomonadales bacterium]
MHQTAMSRTARSVCLLLLVSSAGCASLGCELQPLKPKAALRCEMPIG